RKSGTCHYEPRRREESPADGECRMQNAECKMQNAKCKMQNAKQASHSPLVFNSALCISAFCISAFTVGLSPDPPHPTARAKILRRLRGSG
ncbi:MAG TPA: hypothetical protein VHL59_08555, partial [Thermoanaerobaculia bacterium]|nr:hypothetical protein [Thermoanaerobaculia bacterium]